MKLLKKDIEIRELSAIEVLECTKLADSLKLQLKKEDFNEELTDVICENGALAFMCVYYNDKKLFNSPKDALKNLKLSQLVDIYDYYQSIFIDKLESCENENF